MRNGTRWGRRAGSALMILGAMSWAGCSEMNPVCGATTPAGACVNVVSVVGLEAGKQTDDVDLTDDFCTQGTGTFAQTVQELFTDHDAMITVQNETYPGGPPNGALVTFDHVQIDYKLNECPTGAVCPGLSSWTIDSLTVSINPGQTTTFTIPMVPIRKKQEYLNNGGTFANGAFPSYNARFTLTGNGDPGDQITLVGSAEFSFGSWDNCPPGWKETSG